MPELGYHWEPPTKFVEGIHPIMYIQGKSKIGEAPYFGAFCQLCGEVTQRESNGIIENATEAQAGLYVQRHLARHLAAISNEIAKFAR